MPPFNHPLSVIDTHFHMWDLQKQNLPWLATTDGTITKTFSFADYLEAWAAVAQDVKADTGVDLDFTGGIYVEVDGDDPLLEDQLVYKVWKKEPKLLACAMRARVEPTMRAPLFAHGVREPLHIPENPKGRCLEPSFIEGLHYMAQHGFVFDSCNRVDELQDFLACAKQVPELTIVLNHLGNVSKLDENYKAVMQEFAKLDNVYVKVSGHPTADTSFVNDLLMFTKETFNPQRLVFASNWPVIYLYGSLTQHVEECLEVFADDGDFWSENAKCAYKLK